MTEVSIVIPTYNENQTPPQLIERVKKALGDISHDIWFIDDSTDNTPEILETLSRHCAGVHVRHRENTRGLGTAVVLGFSQAQGKYLIVMDADLQHPPELLPEIVTALRSGAEIVIPSRFIRGGSDGGLGFFRKMISWTARALGRALVPELRRTSDCTSGFFGLNRAVIQGVNLTPASWKILIEILCKGNYSKVVEIPYFFLAREAGMSKMSLKEQWHFLKHIYGLRQAN